MFVPRRLEGRRIEIIQSRLFSSIGRIFQARIHFFICNSRKRAFCTSPNTSTTPVGAPVSIGEARDQPLAMLMYPFDEVARRANVDRPFFWLAMM